MQKLIDSMPAMGFDAVQSIAQALDVKTVQNMLTSQARGKSGKDARGPPKKRGTGAATRASGTTEAPADPSPAVVGRKRKFKSMARSSDVPDDGSDSKSSQSSDGESDSSAKPAVMVPCNKKLADLAGKIKSEALEMIRVAGVIKLYIQLNIPQIEDGNNFGVEIQEETVAEINRVEDVSFHVLDQISKYFATRGKFVSKVIKYPEIEDYPQSVRELDFKMYVSLKMACIDQRNNYSILYDLITKNEEKIQKPRGLGNAAEFMY